MKTTVDIADGLFAEAKECAARQGVSFRTLVEEGLRTVVDRAKPKGAPFRLGDGSFGGQGLAEERSWSETRSLIYEGRGE
jgi:hypothetical protein